MGRKRSQSFVEQGPPPDESGFPEEEIVPDKKPYWLGTDPLGTPVYEATEKERDMFLCPYPGCRGKCKLWEDTTTMMDEHGTRLNFVCPKSAKHQWVFIEDEEEATDERGKKFGYIRAFNPQEGQSDGES